MQSLNTAPSLGRPETQSHQQPSWRLGGPCRLGRSRRAPAPGAGRGWAVGSAPWVSPTPPKPRAQLAIRPAPPARAASQRPLRPLLLLLLRRRRRRGAALARRSRSFRRCRTFASAARASAGPTGRCHAEPRAHGRPPSRVAQRGERGRAPSGVERGGGGSPARREDCARGGAGWSGVEGGGQSRAGRARRGRGRAAQGARPGAERGRRRARHRRLAEESARGAGSEAGCRSGL